MSLMLDSLLHPLLKTPDGIVVVSVLEAPEGPRLVTGLGPGVGHCSLNSLGSASTGAVIGGLLGFWQVSGTADQ